MVRTTPGLRVWKRLKALTRYGAGLAGADYVCIQSVADCQDLLRADAQALDRQVKEEGEWLARYGWFNLGRSFKECQKGSSSGESPYHLPVERYYQGWFR